VGGSQWQKKDSLAGLGHHASAQRSWGNRVSRYAIIQSSLACTASLEVDTIPGLPLCTSSESKVLSQWALVRYSVHWEWFFDVACHRVWSTTAQERCDLAGGQRGAYSCMA
jgi:hypothetical protein